jgi:oligoribonuclease NrnB/cAMP/cGMP phosphodiesterase (DHH superfamily)
MNNGGHPLTKSGTSLDQKANETGFADHLLTTPVPDGFSWAPDLVIYHDKCADGIVAAWACWKRWGEEPEYLAANYGYQPPSDVQGRNILLVDFSFPEAELRAMVAAGARSIVILDHHKTAQEALEPFTVASTAVGWYDHTDIDGLLTAREWADDDAPNVIAIFDMERSGARMAWEFAHPGEAVPQLVRLAERYDLWQFQPNTGDAAELLHLDIQAGTMSIADMEAIDREFSTGDAPLVRGAAIDAWRLPLIREIAGRAHMRTVGGVEGVISVECPYSLVSAIGHHLLDEYPTAPFAAMSVTGEKAVTWSLRSRDGRTDVSEVAKAHGGGGHRNAAGFRVGKLDQAALRERIAAIAADLSANNPVWTAGCLADALLADHVIQEII